MNDRAKPDELIKARQDHQADDRDNYPVAPRRLRSPLREQQPARKRAEDQRSDCAVTDEDDDRRPDISEARP